MNTAAGFGGRPMSQGQVICRFFQRGMCRFGNRCRNMHGQPNGVKLKPEAQQSASSSNSSSQEMSNTDLPQLSTLTESGPSTSLNTPMEIDSETASKSCGICFDTVVEKSNRNDQTFGILPNCNHCFCFTCIIKWRQTKEFDLEVSKACPECRRPSDYVYPSKIWFNVQEEKVNFITKEKTRMQQINCRYFKKGIGSCPFGNKCLYLHALPNGTKFDVGSPKPRRHRRSNTENDMLYQILYWLNDDDLDIEDGNVDDFDDGSVDDLDDEFDSADPLQYYDDLQRYMTIERLVNNSNSESDDFDFMFTD